MGMVASLYAHRFRPILFVDDGFLAFDGILKRGLCVYDGSKSWYST